MPIQRRNFLGSIGAAGLLGLVSPREQRAQEQAARATRAEFSQVVESAKRYMAQGFRHVRVQIGVPGMSGYGGGGAANVPIKALHDKPVYEPASYIRRALKMFEVCRKELGDEVELLHDV